MRGVVKLSRHAILFVLAKTLRDKPILLTFPDFAVYSVDIS